MERCELARIIPQVRLDEVFRNSNGYMDVDYTFMGFEDVYKAVTLFVPKNRVIIDLGCAYAFQSWYFRGYKKYVGVDYWVNETMVLKTENSEFYFMPIQEFITDVFPGMGYRLDEVFAVCSYVPDDDAMEKVREFFPHCLVYYP